MTSTLHLIDWAVIILYMATMVIMGWRASRGSSKSLEDYFVGGRNVGSIMAGISLMTTLLSTISYLAYPGEVIAHGAGFVWQILALPVVFAVVGYFLIPHIMSFQVNSAYELLETRLGPRVRTLAACIFVLLRLVWIAFVFHAACTAMAVIIGISREWLMVVMGAVTLMYTVEGGIRAVIWTDVVQFCIKLGGVLFIMFYVMNQSDFGLGSLLREGWQSTLETPLFSFDPSVRTTAASWAISIGVWWIATCGSDQIAMQRFFMNRDVATARRTLLVNLVASMATILALAAVGIALLHYFRQNLDSLPVEYRDFTKAGDKIFPYFLSHGMPIGLSGLMIAALLAAAMSALSGGFNSLTAVLTVDFFKRGSNVSTEPSDHAQDRRRAQMITLMIGLITFGIAYPLKFANENFMSLSGRLMEPLTGPLFGLFALAFFVRRADERSALVGFFAGLASGFFLAFGHLLLGRPIAYSWLWISPVSIVITVGVGYVVAAMGRQSGSEGTA